MTIEDEFLFLMQCPMYSHIKSIFFFKRSKNVFNFSLLNSKLQFNWLLANSDNLVIIQLANFVYDCFEIHGK